MVEEARVIDEAAEAVRPVARDPVHHVPAVGAAERAGAITVEPREFLGCGREALLQILERLAAPVAADRVGEGLPVSGRAVEVDEDDAIACAGEYLRVPAVAPGICETRLRSAMHDERDRVAPVGREIPGLDRVSVDLLAARALESELLEWAEP